MEMKKCPFCGKKVQIFVGIMAGINMIVCSNCGATVSFGGKEVREETIKAWNKRAGNEEP